KDGRHRIWQRSGAPVRDLGGLSNRGRQHHRRSVTRAVELRQAAAGVMKDFTHSLTIDAPPAGVLAAFFTHDSLASWWHVTRSLCVPRPLGVYAVEWDATEWRDEVLGRLGGAFKGTVIEFKPGREFFIADAYWLPPDGEPIGPMGFDDT